MARLGRLFHHHYALQAKMTLFKKLAGDSLWLLIARIGAQGAMVVVTYILARRMGAPGFGEYAFLAAVIVVGNVLTTFGSDMVLIREIAAKDNFSDVPAALLLQLMLSFVFVGCVYLFAPSIPSQTTESILALKIYSIALIPLAFFTVFTSVLRGVQRIKSYALLNLGVAIIQVSAMLIFVQRETSIMDLAYVLLGVQILGTLLAGLLCVPLFSFLRDWHFSLERIFPLFIVCLPVAVIAILGILYQKTGLAMLSLLGTSTMVGIFSASARVIEAARLGHVAVFTMLYPVMANLDHGGAFRKTLKFSWGILLVVSIIGSALIFLLSKPIIDIFYGDEYQSSILVLKILAFTLIPYTANSFLSLAYLATRKEKVVLRVFAVSLLLLLILNFWFIPVSGEAGAGWAILITESLQMVMFLLAWLRDSSRQPELIPSRGGSYEFSDLS
jgi:PST family polysaccharide transporter